MRVTCSIIIRFYFRLPLLIIRLQKLHRDYVFFTGVIMKKIHSYLSRSIVISVFFIILSGCSSTGSSESARSPLSSGFIRTEIYCGLNKPHGGVVSEADWQKFLNDTVTPVFKTGYSVMNAEGRWMDTQTERTITEKTKIIVIIYQWNNEIHSAIDKIIATYKKNFQQQAVMRLDYRVSARFL